jgi:hypothetical protein
VTDQILVPVGLTLRDRSPIKFNKGSVLSLANIDFFEEKKNLFPLLGIELPVSGHPCRNVDSPVRKRFVLKLTAFCLEQKNKFDVSSDSLINKLGLTNL